MHDADEVSGGDRDRRQAAQADERDAQLSALAARAAAGDGVAMDRFLEQIRPPVVRYCRAKLGSRTVGLQTAEDVAQDVLLAVCGALPRYRAGDTRMMSFVFGIASNKVVDAYRASGRDRSDPTENLPESLDAGAGPELTAVLTTQVDELRTLLAELPEQHREVLVLRVALRYSAEETARIVGSTSGAVRVTQHRAMARLRRLIADRNAMRQD